MACQCLRRGLVDQVSVYVLPVLLGDAIRFSSPGLTRINLEPVGLWQRTRPDTEYADAESGVFPYWRLAG